MWNLRCSLLGTWGNQEDVEDFDRKIARYLLVYSLETRCINCSFASITMARRQLKYYDSAEIAAEKPVLEKTTSKRLMHMDSMMIP